MKENNSKDSRNRKMPPRPPIKPNFKGGKNDKKGFNFYWIYGIIAVGFILLTFFNNSSTPTDTIQWGQLKTIIEKGDASKIIVINKDENAEIFIKKDVHSILNLSKVCK